MPVVYTRGARNLPPKTRSALSSTALSPGEAKTVLAKEFGISRETVYTYLRDGASPGWPGDYPAKRPGAGRFSLPRGRYSGRFPGEARGLPEVVARRPQSFAAAAARAPVAASPGRGGRPPRPGAPCQRAATKASTPRSGCSSAASTASIVPKLPLRFVLLDCGPVALHLLYRTSYTAQEAIHAYGNRSAYTDISCRVVRFCG